MSRCGYQRQVNILRLGVFIAIHAASFFVPARSAASFPSPYLHLSFDESFSIEGTGSGTLRLSPGSPFPGIKKVPAGEFTEGISGRAFIPAEALVIEGEKVFPAPEGTLSLWVKPVKHKEDWAGGPALTSGRIGPFVRSVMKGEQGDAVCQLTVRYGRHDCCGGLHWVEKWKEQLQDFRTTGPNVPFAVWEDDKWRLLTVVWSRGERKVYMDGLLMQHGKAVPLNPDRCSSTLEIPAGSKAVDEIALWDYPLSDAQVMALFYALKKQSGLLPAVQAIPHLKTAPEISPEGISQAWNGALTSSMWLDSLSGTAVDVNDTLQTGYAGDLLFIRYRQPMPRNYEAVKTVLGGAMLRRSVQQKDGPIRRDDAVQVILKPGDGACYTFGLSAGGARYDARNGNAAFDFDGWKVEQREDEKFWSIDMCIDLAALTAGKMPKTLGFNFIRTVRQQGFARRQWSFDPGDPAGCATIALQSGNSVPATELSWSAASGCLTVEAAGASGLTPTVEYAVRPLGYTAIFPEETVLNKIISQAGGDGTPPMVSGKDDLRRMGSDGKWKGRLDYAGEQLALASAELKDAGGNLLARRSCLISGNRVLGLSLLNKPGSDSVVVVMRLASEALVGKDVSALVELIPGGADKPVSQVTVRGFNNVSQEVSLDLARVPVGPYTVRVTLSGRVSGTATEQSFRSGRPEWLGHDIGIIKEVPSPWTPVLSRDGGVEVWGRRYAFGRSLLPVSVQVLGEEILSGPMRLLISADGEELDTARAGAPAVIPDNTGIKASLSGKITGKTLAVEMAGNVEFDGFAHFDFTLKPLKKDKPVSVGSIILEVPFKCKYAGLYDDSSYNMFTTKSGALPEGGLTAGNVQAVRLGDADRGIQFAPLFGPVGRQSDAGPVSVIPKGDIVLFRYVVSEGVVVDKPLQLEMGFIGTPVKPRDARRIRLTSHAGVLSIPGDLQAKGYAAAKYWNAGWTNFGGGNGKEEGYYNFTKDWCRGLAEMWQDTWQKSRQYPTLYTVPGRMTSHTPEFALFQDEWRNVPNTPHIDGLSDLMIDLSHYNGASVRPERGRWLNVCWADKGYQDFYFYSLDKVLSAFARQGVRVGVYLDCTHDQVCANTLHGHGIKGEDGLIQPEYDFLGYRQWAQRFYQVVRKNSPDGLIVIHTSGDRRMALWGLMDVLVEGEQYTANWQAYMVNRPELTFNDAYPAALPLDRARASYAATLWGPQHVFLTQFWTDKRQQEDIYKQSHAGRMAPSYQKRMRYIAGLMRLHDVPLWGEFLWAAGGEDPWIRMARWGFDDTVKFIPYWDNGGLLNLSSPDSQEAAASAWIREDGSLMVLLFNNSAAAVTLELRINEDKAPVRLKSFRQAVDITSPDDILEPEKKKADVYAYTGGTVRVEMRPRDCRLLVFE